MSPYLKQYLCTGTDLGAGCSSLPAGLACQGNVHWKHIVLQEEADRRVDVIGEHSRF